MSSDRDDLADSVETETFGFLLIERFSFVGLSSAADVLAMANYVSGRRLYRWFSIGIEPGTVDSVSGFKVAADYTLDNAPASSSIVVCCGIGGNQFDNERVGAWLRRRHTHGARVGAISTGTWVLARAGLLDGRRCTIHWEDLAAFRETYPDLDVSTEIFEIDGSIFTCSGGTSAMDMLLSMVAVRHGIELALKVAEQVIVKEIRSEREHQRSELPFRLGIRHRAIVRAVEVMEENLEVPVSLVEIARTIDVSVRHLERLFRRHMNCTPRAYYLQLRLHRARTLLKGTSMPVLEVAAACGFESTSYFARCYRRLFGLPPSEDRVMMSTLLPSDDQHADTMGATKN